MPLVLVVPPRPFNPVAAVPLFAVPASADPRGILKVPKPDSVRPV
jgi:hypothetical protein